MERSHSQPQAIRLQTIPPQLLSDFLNRLTQGFRLSSKCLGVGVLLISMEAPALAHPFGALEPSAAETELVEALADRDSAPLATETEAAVNDELETFADSIAEVVIGDGDDAWVEEPSLEDRPEQDATAQDAVQDVNASAAEASVVEASGLKGSDAEAPVLEASGEEGLRSEEIHRATGGEIDAIATPGETAVESPEQPTEASETELADEGEEEEASDSDSDETVEPGETEEVAQEAPPIPTLGERCAAPEATLFPLEPEAEAEAETEAAGLETESQDETRPTNLPSEEEAAVREDALENPTSADELSTNSPDATTSETNELEAREPEAIADSDPEDIAVEPEPLEPEAPEKVAEASAEEVPVVEPNTAIEDLDKESKAEAAAKAAEEKKFVCALYQADQQYQAGELAEAKATYQSVKDPFAAEAKTLGLEQKPAITNPEELSAGGQVFFREAAAGREQQLETRILVPLDLLVKQHPEFIPGQVQLAEALIGAGRSEEALARLQEASSLYPDEPELLQAHIAIASEQEAWMDAVMLARRFAQLNPEHPQADEFIALAEENMALFQREMRSRLRANTIANVITGAVSVALTGNLWNSLSSIQTTTMMLRGEEGVGNGISKSIKRQVELVEDEEVLNYVQTMGAELAAVAGRDEFDYEFNLLMDPNLNAFALPGGKIFVNAGAIAKTKSKAELAGLLSHELAHAVLSHGFRLVSDGSLLSDISRFVPFGGYASNLVVLNYSRDMEREADELGARILASAGYAADGLHGLMKTLGEQDTRKPLFAWMSTHPETDERVGNLEAQITQEGLERYQFEGVEEHFRMRIKVMRLIDEWKERKAQEEKERPWWR